MRAPNPAGGLRPVDGQLTVNTTALIVGAAMAGFGIAYVPQDQARDHLETGRLTWVLQDWSPRFSGYHLYYPSRRQNSSAFAVLIEALRARS